MSEIFTGGPAFPIECNIVNGYRADEGLTVRDYFAAQALPAVVQSVITVERSALEKAASAEGYSGSIHGFAAKIAYQYADAMLAHKYATDPKPPSVDDDRPF